MKRWKILFIAIALVFGLSLPAYAEPHYDMYGWNYLVKGKIYGSYGETIENSGTDGTWTCTPASTGSFNIVTGNLKVGDGTPSVTLNGEDGYIEGTFEVDGAVRFDSTLSLSGTLTQSDVTDASSLTAGSVVTAGGLAVAKQLFLGDDLDMSVSGTGTYDITLKTNMADALSITDGTDIIVFNTTTGSPTVTITPATTITGALSLSSTLGMLDDMALTIGTTTTNAATKITMEMDSVSGIGQLRMGDLSNPQVLNANPGATIVGDIVNILHSAGAGDCADLYGGYIKVAISGAGDSGTTLVGHAPRAYVLAGDAQEVYGSQPWAKHSGTGSMLAMSAVSAALILNDADAFEATNSINAGHFHIKTASGAANGAVTSSNFDGVMVEVYGNVTGMDSLLNLSNGGTSTDSMIKMTTGSAVNVFEFAATSDSVVVTGGTYSTADGYLVMKVGSSTYRIPFFSGVDGG